MCLSMCVCGHTDVRQGCVYLYLSVCVLAYNVFCVHDVFMMCLCVCGGHMDGGYLHGCKVCGLNTGD